MPDARKRLTHVVKLTDEAAHRTLDLVELCGPLVDEAARGAAQLLESRNLPQWPERAAEFLGRTRSDTDALRAHLSELLMAQGYQDITGQIIRSVIALVDELERVLGKLVQIAEGIEVTSLVRSCRRRRIGSRAWVRRSPELPMAMRLPARTTSTHCCRRWRRASDGLISWIS